MAQSRAKFTYDHAVEYRERLIDAFCEAQPYPDDLRHRAEQVFVCKHVEGLSESSRHDEWIPYEYSYIEVRNVGENGMTEATIHALAELGVGVVEEQKEVEDGVSVTVHSVSSYQDPAWDWANPNAGPDPTRPPDERDPEVQEWIDERRETEDPFQEPRGD